WDVGGPEVLTFAQIGRAPLSASTIGQPSKEASRLPVNCTVPCLITPGNAQPTGSRWAASALGRNPSCADCSASVPTTEATVAVTASGIAGCGVSSRTRRPSILPVVTSTRPAFVPVPPMSMPIASRAGSTVPLCDMGDTFRVRAGCAVQGRTVLGRAGSGRRPRAVGDRRAGGGEREDVRARVRDDERVLELRGAPAVRGDDRPLVVPLLPLLRAQVEHRLDREDHAGLHDPALVRRCLVV